MDFEKWLHTAVKQLPKDVQTVVQDELTAHYLDAVDAYIAAGLSKKEANETALIDLGQASQTQQQLKETHCAGRRYKTAVLLGTLMPIGLLLPIFFIQFFGSMDLVIFIFLALPALYGFTTFRIYLEQQYGFYEAKRPLFLLKLCGTSILLANSLTLIFFQESLLFMMGAFYFEERPFSTSTIFVIIAIVAIIGVALSLIWLGEQLMGLPTKPELPLHIFRSTLLVGGASILITVVVAWLANILMSVIFTNITIVALVTQYAFLIWLLFRASVNSINQPMQFT